ncbi:hypothetical protein [Psychroflexus sp. MES1-P1E]|uniref:hypothetical protein n=1 Tax=Psychroflexus sp. MES1-P1E TaxID=2058320 RepID=UPI000C7D6D33|nr:hypothetical protein [Psychroflexus sp. MES1-P1E]PKG43187.1 hypothetical protein CXF67_06245 [Psychroflexus sp. MES1-P1E]
MLPDELVSETRGFESKLSDSSPLKDNTPILQKLKILGKGDTISWLPTSRLEGGADYRGDDTVLGF